MKAARSPSSLLVLGTTGIILGALACPVSGNSPCDVSSDAALATLAEAGELQCDLLIQNTAFATLDPLEGVQSTPYNVTLRGNQNLIDASAVAQIRATGLYVDGNPALPAITFELDGSVGDFVVAENPALASVSTPNLVQASMWAVRDGPAESISAAALEDVGTLVIKRTGVAELAFPNLRRISTIVINENTALPAAAVDGLLEQLEEQPSTIQRCGNLDEKPCPKSEKGELNP